MKGASPSTAFALTNYEDLRFFVMQTDRGFEELTKVNGEKEVTIELDCPSLSLSLPLDMRVKTSGEARS